MVTKQHTFKEYEKKTLRVKDGERELKKIVDILGEPPKAFNDDVEEVSIVCIVHCIVSELTLPTFGLGKS